MQAHWNGQLIAESDDTVIVEGNHYFPKSAVQQSFLQPSEHQTYCPWKGDCRYYHVVVDGTTNQNAAWFYPEPKPAAAEIGDRIAFWKGVVVS